MKIIILLLLSIISFRSFAQQTKPIDYIELSSYITNDIGNFSSKFNPAIEIGRQWDVFSLGLAIGKTNTCPSIRKDTSWFFEARPNLNIFQVGKFVNTFTPGIGIIPNGNQTLMIEMTSGIEYSLNEKYHINITFGQYYYSGLSANSNVAFFGISIARYFSPYHPKSIITNK